MKKTIFLSTFVSLFFLQEANTQDLHVYYDAQTEVVRYEYKGKTIYKPRVGNGGSVFLHIKNFNNYIYTSSVEVDEKTVKEAGGAGIGGLKGMMGGGGGMGMLGGGLNFPTGGNFFGGAGDAVDGIEFPEHGFGADKESMSALNSLTESFSSSMAKMKKIEKNIEEVHDNVTNAVESRKINHIVQEEINHLKTNPNLRPEQIRSLSKEYMEKVFNVDTVDAVNLSLVLERSDMKGVLQNNLKDLKKQKSRYDGEVRKLETMVGLADAINVQSKDFSKLKNTMKDTYDHSKELQNKLEKDQSTIQEMIPQVQQEDVRMLTALRYEYEAIAANDFSKTYRIPAQGDNMEIQMKFTLKDTSLNTAKEIVPFPIEIPVGGRFKVNTSVGISFGSLFNRPQNYFARDSAIVAEDKDSFTPFITSYFNFYFQNTTNISVGGTFGLGFPLGGADQTISFLLGPSLVVGKGSRIVINAGILGTKVDRLAQGLQVGDPVSDGLLEVPVSSKYELGMFLGLSFNLTSGL